MLTSSPSLASSPSPSSSWTQKEIKRFLLKARRVVQSTSVDIRTAPCQSDRGRLLVVTPKKIGNAPQRNRFRRRVKAIFHEQKLAAFGRDFGVFAKTGAPKLSFTELTQLMLTACAQPRKT